MERISIRRSFLHLFVFLILFGVSFPLLVGADKKTVCLNMIVKNEKDVIERCLASVKPIIDYWIIVDTGSYDGTQEIIKAFMKDIPGELYERPWKNFGHNRNEALDLARTKADYVLIIDADDTLEYAPNFVLPELTQDAYQLQIVYGSVTFYRPHLINMKLPWVWKGVLHEYLFCPLASHVSILDGVKYMDTRSGARSKDPTKYKKDAAILEEALKEEPNNSRYVFYLAQSYRDACEFEKSISWYSKRVEMGGWKEEVYYSLYQIACLKEMLKKDQDDVITSYYRAYRYRPHRPEAIFHLARIFREQGNYALAYATLKSWNLIPHPAAPDILFVESWIEQYGILTEISISSYYVGRYAESLYACDSLLANKELPKACREQIERNRQFSLEKLPMINAG